MKEKLALIQMHLRDIVNDDISNADYAESCLMAYINDFICTLCEYIQNVLDK